jgi:hypothetical protein
MKAASAASNEPDAAVMAEPFGDGDKQRAAWCVNELSTGNRSVTIPPHKFETKPIPTHVL